MKKDRKKDTKQKHSDFAMRHRKSGQKTTNANDRTITINIFMNDFLSFLFYCVFFYNAFNLSESDQPIVYYGFRFVNFKIKKKIL